MFEKIFRSEKFFDEKSIISSFINHTAIEKEKLKILEDLVDCICDKPAKITDCYQKIRSIHQEEKKINQEITAQIIEANFDRQKQYDLLGLYQSIEKFSELIIAAAKRILILANTRSTYPAELKQDLKELMRLLKKQHEIYVETLNTYQNDPKNTILCINKVVDLENQIDRLRSICLENLYKLGNNNKLGIGTFRIIEEIIEHIEDISDAIEETAKNISWLLLS